MRSYVKRTCHSVIGKRTLCARNADYLIIAVYGYRIGIAARMNDLIACAAAECIGNIKLRRVIACKRCVTLRRVRCNANILIFAAVFIAVVRSYGNAYRAGGYNPGAAIAFFVISGVAFKRFAGRTVDGVVFEELFKFFLSERPVIRGNNTGDIGTVTFAYISGVRGIGSHGDGNAVIDERRTAIGIIPLRVGIFAVYRGTALRHNGDSKTLYSVNISVSC